PGNDRFVVPNEKLASDTIRNSTIRGRDTFAEVTAQVPAAPGLAKALQALEGVGEEAYVSDLAADKATILVRRWVSDEQDVERGAGVAWAAGCDLSTLRPVEIGQNSFVYARDGSLLGSIPAERNREPVGLRHIAKWLPRATVAIEDRRFYQHGGVDYEGIAR